MSQSAKSSTLRPRDINLDRSAHELRVTWNDGHVSVYPLDALREACPCALCRGGHEYMGEAYDPDLLMLTPARQHEIKDMQLAGNYALQITWDDGHDAGFYTWSYLRRICPCDECNAEPSPEDDA